MTAAQFEDQEGRDLVEAIHRRKAWPVGTPVRYWPGLQYGEGVVSVTRSPVFDVCGTPCVSVEGYAGGIALDHVERLSETVPTATRPIHLPTDKERA